MDGGTKHPDGHVAAVGLGTATAVGAGEWGHTGGQDCGGVSDYGHLPHQL